MVPQSAYLPTVLDVVTTIGSTALAVGPIRLEQMMAGSFLADVSVEYFP